MIDGPHLDDILEPGKGPLDFAEIFVDFHRFDRGEIRLLTLQDVFAFQSFFLLELFRVFKIVELTVSEFPIVVSESVVASEHSGGCRANFLRRLQLASLHSALERFEFLPHSLHRFFAFPALVVQPLLTVGHERPHAGLIGRHLLHQRLRYCGLFARGDSRRALHQRPMARSI